MSANHNYSGPTNSTNSFDDLVFNFAPEDIPTDKNTTIPTDKNTTSQIKSSNLVVVIGIAFVITFLIVIGVRQISIDSALVVPINTTL